METITAYTMFSNTYLVQIVQDGTTFKIVVQNTKTQTVREKEIPVTDEYVLPLIKVMNEQDGVRQ